MHRVIGVRFKQAGKIYYFDPDDIKLNKGDGVIVETIRGIEHGSVIVEECLVGDEEIISPLKKVIRKATEQDLKHIQEQKSKEVKAAEICRQKIAARQLPMKLINVEYTFDDNKIIFNFTAEGRIDFRELVKDLAAVFRTRIELRQIGIRDEAKTLGGLGCCGQELCCKRWLVDFNPVSIKMAKTQNLSLNTTKISGTCSRLMCCLKYENDVYEEFKAGFPKEGTRVMTPVGEGRVTEANVFSQKISVELNTSKINRDFDLNELVILQGDEIGSEITEKPAATSNISVDNNEILNGEWLVQEGITTAETERSMMAESAQQKIKPSSAGAIEPDSNKKTAAELPQEQHKPILAGTETARKDSVSEILKNTAARYARESSISEESSNLFETEMMTTDYQNETDERTNNHSSGKYATTVRRNRSRRSDSARTDQAERQNKKGRTEKKEHTDKTAVSARSEVRENAKKTNRQDKSSRNEYNEKSNKSEKSESQLKNTSKNRKPNNNKPNNNKQATAWSAEKNNGKSNRSGDKKRGQETGEHKDNSGKSHENKQQMKNFKQSVGNQNHTESKGKGHTKAEQPVGPNVQSPATAGMETKEKKSNSKKAPWFRRAIGKKDNNK